jgi:hypothetical protein
MKRTKRVRYDPANDLYIVLGVPPSATIDEIRRTFRQRAKEVHPDRNLDRVEWAHEQFQRLNEAYDLLSDEQLRAEYDTRRFAHHRGRDVDGVAWWERPNPPTPPRSAPDWSRDSDTSPKPPPMSRPATRINRKKQQNFRTYHVLFIVSTIILAGSICAWMPRFQVRVNDIGNLGFETPTPFVVGSAATPELPVTLVAAGTPGSTMPCQHPDAMISEPQSGAIVPAGFVVRGTASGEHFASYRVEFAPYTIALQNPFSNSIWGVLAEGEMPNRVENAVLVSAGATSRIQPGDYLLRLIVMLDTGELLPYCQIIVFRRDSAGTPNSAQTDLR